MHRMEKLISLNSGGQDGEKDEDWYNSISFNDDIGRWIFSQNKLESS